MLKTFPKIPDAMVIKPQFWDNPFMPNVSAASVGNTPKRIPYATAVKISYNKVCGRV